MSANDPDIQSPASPEDAAAARRARKLLHWVVALLVFVNLAIILSMFLAP